MSVKMYLSWRTKQRKFSPLGAKHHFLLLFCPPVRLHLHKVKWVYRGACCIYNQLKYSHYIVKSLQGTIGHLTLIERSYKDTITTDVYVRISVNN